MPEWMSGWPLLGVYLFFLVGAVARSQAIFWVGRGVAAGALRTRWKERAESARVRRATRTVERWGMPIVPAAFLTVGFQSAVFLAVGVLRVGWLRFTVWSVPGCLVWAALWGGGGLAVLAGARELADRSPWLLALALLAAGGVVVAVTGRVRRRREARESVAELAERARSANPDRRRP
jgi:membrane protein DedA with SNARE-associated domain